MRLRVEVDFAEGGGLSKTTDEFALHTEALDHYKALYPDAKRVGVERVPDMDGWLAAARQLGVEHAKACATWVTDGNDTDASRQAKLQQLADDGPGALLPMPNLSGEWGDDLNPRKLFEQATGLDAHAESSFNMDAYNTVLDDLCTAYEDGVHEAFEPAIEAELRRWLAL